MHPIPVLLSVVAIALPVSALPAQTPQTLITRGDSLAAARNAPEALKAYEAALAQAPTNYEALWKSSRTNIDLGEFEPNDARRSAFFKAGESRARQAIQANSTDAEGHFALARALGRVALSLGVRDRVKYAKDVREQALSCLKADPKHPGCLHVMGQWNAEVMRLSGFSRMVAKTFLGGQVFGEASWEEAQRYLTEAVANDPHRIIHRLELGNVYADRGMKAQARSQYEVAIKGELIDYNDPQYKKEAQAALAEL